MVVCTYYVIILQILLRTRPFNLSKYSILYTLRISLYTILGLLFIWTNVCYLIDGINYNFTNYTYVRTSTSVVLMSIGTICTVSYTVRSLIISSTVSFHCLLDISFSRCNTKPADHIDSSPPPLQRSQKQHAVIHQLNHSEKVHNE